MRKKFDTKGNNNRRYSSPSMNLGTRNRSISRVTTNRDSIRCFRCREYDHFAKKCPNTVIDDSDVVINCFTIDDNISRNS